VLPLTGVILTKVDADSRGGAALSVRMVTGKPIKFLGVGEKTQALDPFHPDRLASRILGMGDMLSLIEEAEQKVDRKKAERIARKVKKGKKFDLEDLRDQLQQMNNMGGMASMLDKMPGMGGMAQMAQAQMDNKTFARMEAMINSMTPRERRNPELDPGLAQTTHHAGLRYAGAGPQPSAQAAQADGENDEEDEGRRHGENDARPRRHDAARGAAACRPCASAVTARRYWKISRARAFAAALISVLFATFRTGVRGCVALRFPETLIFRGFCRQVERGLRIVFRAAALVSRSQAGWETNRRLHGLKLKW
jgi:hypothetical protein